MINLKVEIITKVKTKYMMQINSHQKISELKELLEAQCKIDKKLQQWSFESVKL
jgi:hypothetical protein